MQTCDGCKTSYDRGAAGGRLYCKGCQLTRVADHTQVMTKYGFAVDEELADVIVLLNDNGFVTENSCQQQTQVGNKTWIQFSYYDEVMDLLRRINKNDPDFFEFLVSNSASEWRMVIDEDYEDSDVNDSDSDPGYIISESGGIRSTFSLRFSYDDLAYFKERIKSLFS